MQRLGLIWVVVLLLAPLLLVDLPPLADYPNHLARAVLLAGQDNADLAAIALPRWAVIPNLGLDLLLVPLIRVGVPALLAGRLVLGLALLLPLIGCVAYHRASFGGRSVWPLGAALVVGHGTFLLGFVNFQLGLGPALLAAALWRSARADRPVGTILVVMLVSVVLFFCHLATLAFLLLLIAAQEVETLGRIGWRHLPSRLLAALPLLVGPARLYADSAFAALPAQTLWSPWPEKLLHGAMGFLGYYLWFDLLTVAVLLGGLALCALGSRLFVPRSTWLALAVLAVGYAALPYGAKGTQFLDARLPVMAALLLFAGMAPRLPGWGAIGLLLLITARLGLVAGIWHGHARIIADLRAVIAAVPPGARVLVGVTGGAVTPSLSDGTRTDLHLSALLTIERHAFWPFLFDIPSQQPIELAPALAALAERTSNIPTAADLAVGAPDAADLVRFPLSGRWWCCYDYLLLQGGGLVSDHATLLRAQGSATLYRLKP